MQSLFFDPQMNGVELPSQSIEYDATEGNSIMLGPLKLKGDDVSLTLSYEQVRYNDLEFGLEYKSKRTNMYLLSFKWPREYLDFGRMEILNDKNQIIWSREILQKNIEAWEDFLGNKNKDNLMDSSQVAAGLDLSSPLQFKLNTVSKKHKGSKFGLFGRELLTIPIWKIREPFRFCITQVIGEGRLAACSPRYKFYRSLGRVYLRTSKASVRPRVLVNNQEVQLKGSAIFLDKVSPIKFASLLSTGVYYEFVSSPKFLNIVDIVKTEDGEWVEVIGFGNPPIGDFLNLDRNKEDFWSFMNFMPSIGDMRQFWRARFPYNDPFLYFKGDGGAPFRQAFLFSDLPSTRYRPKIPDYSKDTTYSRKPIIRGELDPAYQISSEEYEAHRTSDTEFEWTFMAKNGGENNRSYLYVRSDKKLWKAYHEVRREYPQEIGLRLTGVLTSDLELVFLGEVATQRWFESLLGWENRLLSQQRWHVAAKYFQAFASLNQKDRTRSLIKLEVIDADLKYRLTPGVWNHDPTIGLMLNYQSLVLEQ
ncbi:MAG: hypothetical protein KDD22_06180, partial [Bdellovibrionales bacterium]|nr:hypothetical protein [Bdellovibrionales bacterium]